MGLERSFRVGWGILGILVAVSLYLLLESRRPVWTRRANWLLTGFALWASLTRAVVDKWDRNQGDRIRWLVLGSVDYLEQLWGEHGGEDPVKIYSFLPQPDELPRSTNCGLFRRFGRDWLKRTWSGVVIALDRDLLELLVIDQLLAARIRGH